MKKAILALEDGTIFEGRAVGADGESAGELVFNTSMTGYQEILTDPSYAGQIVTMTCPHIGNYGVNAEDVESEKPHVRGFVMRECCFEPSNWRATESLPDYLKRHNIVAIDSVDTRHITRLLRTKGAMKSIISTSDLDANSLLAKAKASADMAGSDFVKDVSVKEPYDWSAPINPTYRVIAIDYGIKRNILHLLKDAGCAVTVMPATVSPEEVLAQNPDGVFLSNGPGDPAALPYVYPTVQALIEKKVPIFGICLGHQILAHALGGTTYKLKFGHRGGNQPVFRVETGKVEITAQNHGFAVDTESLEGKDVDFSHIHLNDKTCSGMRHKILPIFSVQYHPESSPGPHDSRYLFESFTQLMDTY
ncbi:MAG: glutamine-hydrolyzing carbamoyl-phosphate synthase small subunit, partial [Candidatus Hydrogenedentes bacterium]|nr:glutamine-hydrolyzing carbamoyl-phosphate synthase small subunit [Candidatus Hydrogenedentota bacterium]